MKSKKTIEIRIPAHGVVLAESVHEAYFSTPEHRDDYAQLVYVLGGEVRLYSGETEKEASVVNLGQGSCLALDRGVKHRFEDVSPATLFILALSPSYIASSRDVSPLWRELVSFEDSDGSVGGGQRIFHLRSVMQVKVLSSLRKIFAEQASKMRGSVLAIQAEVSQLLVFLSRLDQTQGQSNAHARVRSVRASIKQRFYESWDLDMAAAEADMSRRQFSTLFKSVTQEDDGQAKTFLNDLVVIRLAYATTLLAQGNHTITGVAFSSGFGDISNFYRAFKTHYGVTPKAWAERKSVATI